MMAIHEQQQKIAVVMLVMRVDEDFGFDSDLMNDVNIQTARERKNNNKRQNNDGQFLKCFIMS